MIRFKKQTKPAANSVFILFGFVMKLPNKTNTQNVRQHHDTICSIRCKFGYYTIKYGKETIHSH